MACPDKSTLRESSRFKFIFSRHAILTIWLPFLIITTLHYASPPHHPWIHDLLRRAYYLPIVIAAMRSGKLGGLLFTSIVTLAYLPHAFFDIHHVDPDTGLNKSLEIALYFVVAATAGYLSDLECRRRAELQASMAEQKNLTKQLVRAGRLAALGEVVAGIAHEIKNPLHSLAGTAEVVDAEIAEDSPVRKMWEIHKTEIDRLKRTAERFLSFANPQTNASSRINLGDVAARLAELVSADARQKNIQIETAVPDNPVFVLGNTDQLAQVGLNITLNAMTAIGERPGHIRISVGTETINDQFHAFLRIENDGPPIPESDAEHLFDPFHSGGDGTGLGLSISSRIVQQLNGFIEVGNDGLGTVFTVYLNLAS